MIPNHLDNGMMKRYRMLGFLHRIDESSDTSTTTYYSILSVLHDFSNNGF